MIRFTKDLPPGGDAEFMPRGDSVLMPRGESELSPTSFAICQVAALSIHINGDAPVFLKREGQAGGEVLPAGEQNEGCSLHGLTRLETLAPTRASWNLFSFFVHLEFNLETWALALNQLAYRSRRLDDAFSFQPIKERAG